MKGTWNSRNYGCTKVPSNVLSTGRDDECVTNLNLFQASGFMLQA